MVLSGRGRALLFGIAWTAGACTAASTDGGNGNGGKAAATPGGGSASASDPNLPGSAGTTDAGGPAADGSAADGGGPAGPACTPASAMCTPGSGCTLDVTRPAPLTITGTVMRDGYDPASGNAPSMRFVDTMTGEAASFPIVWNGKTYSAKLAPGTYDVFHDYNGFASYRAATALAIGAGTTLDANADKASFSLLLSRDGAQMLPPAFPAKTFLVYTGGGGRQVTDTQFAGAYVGQYDIFVSDDAEDDPGLPVMTNVTHTKGKQLGTQSIHYSETTGTVKLDGALTAGRLRFVDAANNRRFFANADAQGNYRVRMTPGTYDVAFDPSGPTVAGGYWDVAKGVSFAADGTQSFNLATSTITLAATRNGMSFSGNFVLRDAAGVEHVAAVISGAGQTRVPNGTYDTWFDVDAPTEGIRARLRVQAGFVVGGATALTATVAESAFHPSVTNGTLYGITGRNLATGEFFSSMVGTQAYGYAGKWAFWVDMDTPPGTPASARARAPWDAYSLLGVPAATNTVAVGATFDVSPTLRPVLGTLVVGANAAPFGTTVNVDFIDRADGQTYGTSAITGAGGHFSLAVAPGLYDVYVSNDAVGPRIKVLTCAKVD